MTTTIKFTNDAFPPNTEFSVEGIGVLKNGEAKELTEDQERDYAASTRSLVHETAKDSEMFELSGTPAFTTVKDAIGVDPAEITVEAQAPVATVETTAAEQPKSLDLSAEATTGGEN
jgi:hypothetical protein